MMETVRIYHLDELSPSMKQRLREAQREAARVWTLCRDLHLHARQINAVNLGSAAGYQVLQSEFDRFICALMSKPT